MKLRNQRGTTCHNSKRGLGCTDPAIDKSRNCKRSVPLNEYLERFKIGQLRRVSNAILYSFQGTQTRVVLSESHSPGERKNEPPHLGDPIALAQT